MDSTNTEVATEGQHSTAALEEIWETKVFGIAGNTSEKSIGIIQHAFQNKPGVRKVVIDKENHTVTITFDVRQTNMAELHELLLHSGYKPPVSVVPKTE